MYYKDSSVQSLEKKSWALQVCKTLEKSSGKSYDFRIETINLFIDVTRPSPLPVVWEMKIVPVTHQEQCVRVFLCFQYGIFAAYKLPYMYEAEAMKNNNIHRK